MYHPPPFISVVLYGDSSRSKTWTICSSTTGSLWFHFRREDPGSRLLTLLVSDTKPFTTLGWHTVLNPFGVLTSTPVNKKRKELYHEWIHWIWSSPRHVRDKTLHQRLPIRLQRHFFSWLMVPLKVSSLDWTGPLKFFWKVSCTVNTTWNSLFLLRPTGSLFNFRLFLENSLRLIFTMWKKTYE